MELKQFKKCTRCKTNLPLTANYFYRQNGTKDGLAARCKKCIRDGRRLDREAVMSTKYCRHTRCNNTFKSSGSKKLFCSKECRLASYELIMKNIYNRKQMLDRRVRRSIEKSSLLDNKNSFKNGAEWSDSDKEFLLNYMYNGKLKGVKVMVLHSELSLILGRTSASIEKMYSKLIKKRRYNER